MIIEICAIIIAVAFLVRTIIEIIRFLSNREFTEQSLKLNQLLIAFYRQILEQQAPQRALNTTYTPVSREETYTVEIQ